VRIDERINRLGDTLSPQERRAAETLLEHLDDLATYRAAELALLAGVSKATMSRLFRSLGFADFDEVRAHLRELRAVGEPRELESAPDTITIATDESAAIAGVIEQPGVARAARLLAAATRVLVVGWRNSYPVALHLRQQLAQARPQVRVGPLPGQTLGEDLVDLGEGDVLVAVGFRRRPAGFARFLETARASGAHVVLLADPTVGPLAGTADVFLECPVEGSLAFDSYAAAMSLVSVLSDRVLAELGRTARERIARISSTYEALGEVEQPWT
jgi:DNA-binding MurR/RpiR family transcriptional regulator